MKIFLNRREIEYKIKWINNLLFSPTFEMVTVRKREKSEK